MKKIISILLIITLVFSFSVQSFASSMDDSISEQLLDEIDDSIEKITEKVAKVPEIAKNAQDVAKTISGFKGFMENMRYVGIGLSVINGSFVFLKMIGVIKDSNEEAINSIRVQLQLIDEKLYEMDAKLTDITNKMSQMQASIDFNARTEKAILMESRWNDFSYRYMEEGMDKLMDDYDAMIKNGMMAWCKNSSEDARNQNDIDNTKIYVLYKKTSSGYELIHTTENGVPSDFTSDDRYVVISGSCIPSSISWNVNTYSDDITNAIYQAAYSSLYTTKHSGLKISNYDQLIDNIKTKSGSSMVKKLAQDAVSTLIYRVAASQINADANFTNEVVRTYTNYCNHLGASDDGLDAIFKSFYLTHAFEGEVSEDIQGFCNRMSVKNGVYGVFVSNVLGASNSATDKVKASALEQFNKSMKTIEDAEAYGLTGYKDYCYITNTRLYLSEISYRGEVTVIEKEETSSGRRTLGNVSSKALSTEIEQGFKSGAYLMNDASLLLLEKTAKSNGNILNFDYLKANTNSAYTINHGKIVTSYSEPLAFSLDGKTKMSVRNIAGDYFDNKDNITNLPEDASAEYLVYKKKITGSVYDLASNQLSSSQVLIAQAAYGEDHWYWRISETALLAGPNDYEYFYSGVSSMPGDETFDRVYILTSTAKYNMLMCEPLSVELKSSKVGVDPLKSYKNLNNELLNEFQAEEPDIIEDNTKDRIVFSATMITVLVMIMIATYIVMRKKYER